MNIDAYAAAWADIRDARAALETAEEAGAEVPFALAAILSSAEANLSARIAQACREASDLAYRVGSVARDLTPDAAPDGEVGNG